MNNKLVSTSAIDDKVLFSSPQNRRSSMISSSQKSHNSSLSLLDQSMESGRDTIPNSHSITCMDGPRDSSTRGAAVVVTDAGDASSDALKATNPPTGGSRTDLLKVRRSGDRVQEVIGTLPILLVDDSVSILKMTKRAIQNECANIRSIYLSIILIFGILLHNIYSHVTFSALLRPRTAKKRLNG